MHQKPAPPRPATPPSPQLPAPILYTIRPGDTLWSISQRYHVSVAELQAANQLQGTEIIAGDSLVIPARYTVQTGDTLESIANRFQIAESALLQANQLADTTVAPGQVLVIPNLNAAPSPESDPDLVYNLTSRGLPQITQFTANEIVMLAHLVQGEAGNQPFMGQVAVASVVLNRLASPEFPKSLQSVIFQPGQFESVTNGTFWNPPSPQALLATKAAIAGLNPVPDALYFFNPRLTRDSWISSLPVISSIGEQVFAR